MTWILTGFPACLQYLKDHVFDSSLKAVGPELPLGDDLRGYNVLIFGIPTQNLAQVIKPVYEQLDPENMPLTVWVSKGIEKGTDKLPLEILADMRGPEAARVATFLVRTSNLFAC